MVHPVLEIIGYWLQEKGYELEGQGIRRFHFTLQGGNAFISGAVSCRWVAIRPIGDDKFRATFLADSSKNAIDYNLCDETALDRFYTDFGLG